MVTQVIVNRPPAGSSEPEGHAEKMIAKVDNLNPQDPPKEEPKPSEDRPTWLPDKFQSAEDMAKAYAELESKQSQGKPNEAPKEEQKPSEDLPKTDDVKDELASKNLSLEDFSKEFDSKGELSADSYEKLSKAGYNRTLVDAYIEGRKAVAEKYDTTVMGEAGGKDSYVEMVTWAKSGMTPAEQDAYNTSVSSGNLDQARLAVAGLKARYEAEHGKAPRLIGGKPSSTSADTFDSIAQVTEAMKDKRYAKDPAYRKAVQDKLARSDVF